MDTFISHSPAETAALGVQWGREATGPWLIGFGGDLGAGKTQLIRGIASGLGCSSKVHSPTFALINEYMGGRMPMLHLDLYRLNTPMEVEGAGLSQYLTQPPGIVAVEWFERWETECFPEWVHAIEAKALGDDALVKLPLPPTPVRCRWVWMECAGETERRIYYDDIGA